MRRVYTRGIVEAALGAGKSASGRLFNCAVVDETRQDVVQQADESPFVGALRGTRRKYCAPSP